MCGSARCGTTVAVCRFRLRHTQRRQMSATGISAAAHLPRSFVASFRHHGTLDRWLAASGLGQQLVFFSVVGCSRRSIALSLPICDLLARLPMP
ncbi:hypothetical protein PENSPDRAFT_504034 [Peniophora sp. CONT]|nr:hypothetical protein PENSPDRAFT_504034 [Peniophora sp. CONT]